MQGNIRLAKTPELKYNINANPYKYHCFLPARTIFQAINFLEFLSISNNNTIKNLHHWGDNIPDVVDVFKKDFSNFLHQIARNETSVQRLVSQTINFRKALIQKTLFVARNNPSRFFEIDDDNTQNHNSWVSNAYAKTSGGFFNETVHPNISLPAIKIAKVIHHGGRILLSLPIEQSILDLLVFNEYELNNLFSKHSIQVNSPKVLGLGLVFGMTSKGWHLLAVGGIQNHEFSSQLSFSKYYGIEEKLKDNFLIPTNEFKPNIPESLNVPTSNAGAIWSPVRYGQNVLNPPIETPKEEKVEEEEEIKQLLDFYLTDMDGEVITETLVGTRVYLMIESMNLIGEKMDLKITNFEVDFEYQGFRLEDDILKDYTITRDLEKVLLKVIPPENKEQELDLYVTNKKGKIIEEIVVGEEIYLIVKSKDLIGETMDLTLTNKEADFEYQGNRLENDILAGYKIRSNIEKISLKVLAPETEEAQS